MSKYFDDDFLNSLVHREKIIVTIKSPSEIYPELKAIEALHALQGEI